MKAEETQSAERFYLREVEIRFKKKRTKGALGRDPITHAQQIYELFEDLGNETKEKLITINLDIKNRVLCFEVVGIGTVNGVYARPMELFRTSFAVNAYGAIVVHNHPSGDPQPSEDDKKLTQSLLRMSKEMGLNFHDHIIIGSGKYFSFWEEGLLKVPDKKKKSTKAAKKVE